jgi:hypothetical protein
MSTQDFNFLEYLNSLEKMMVVWREQSYQTFRNSTNLGSAREHFITEILKRFLPASVLVGSGEITDGSKRSGQQDIIIYRSDFPVLSGFSSVNTYLIEGVIATIEVKSDLSSGNPTGLSSAFKNVSTVLALDNHAIKLSGDEREFRKLQELMAVKTFVVGYKGWANRKSFVENYRTAGNEVEWQVPNLVYQPGHCIIRNSNISRFNYTDNNQLAPEQSEPLALTSDHSFALFFQHLLRAIMSVKIITTSVPGFNATVRYDLNKYLSLPNIPATPLYPLRVNSASDNKSTITNE